MLPTGTEKQWFLSPPKEPQGGRPRTRSLGSTPFLPRRMTGGSSASLSLLSPSLFSGKPSRLRASGWVSNKDPGDAVRVPWQPSSTLSCYHALPQSTSQTEPVTFLFSFRSVSTCHASTRHAPSLRPEEQGESTGSLSDFRMRGGRIQVVMFLG